MEKKKVKKRKNKKQNKIKRNIINKHGRASTGISKLDNLLKGGFEEGTINLLVGESGSGKSLFGLHYLLEGIKKGETVVFISFEERKESFYRNAKEIGLDLESLEKKGKFYFSEYTPQKIKAMLDEGGGAIETLVLSKKIKRLVFDSIASFLMMYEKVLEKREGIISLFHLIRSWECTSMITHIEGDFLNGTTQAIIGPSVDSLILLNSKNVNHQKKKFLEILKMRGTEHSTKLHHYKIGKRGIEL